MEENKGEAAAGMSGAAVSWQWNTYMLNMSMLNGPVLGACFAFFFLQITQSTVTLHVVIHPSKPINALMGGATEQGATCPSGLTNIHTTFSHRWHSYRSSLGLSVLAQRHIDMDNVIQLMVTS